MKKSIVLVVLIAAFTALVVPALGSTAVRVSDNKFTSKIIRVGRGATVKWTWSGASEGHNVRGPGFRSPVQTRGTFSHRFSRSGVYHYVCTLHSDEGMRGTVIVR